LWLKKFQSDDAFLMKGSKGTLHEDVCFCGYNEEARENGGTRDQSFHVEFLNSIKEELTCKEK